MLALPATAIRAEETWPGASVLALTFSGVLSAGMQKFGAMVEWLTVLALTLAQGMSTRQGEIARRGKSPKRRWDTSGALGQASAST
jgi:hypothetical protein